MQTGNNKGSAQTVQTHMLIIIFFVLMFQTSPVVSVAAEPSIHVRVEHSDLDTLHMKIEDFTSQPI